MRLEVSFSFIFFTYAMRYNTQMNISRIVEYVFFFGLLIFAGFMVWQIAAPFITALALSAIIVTICHPLHQLILKRTPKNNKTAAAFLTTVTVLVAIVLPLSLLTSLLVGEVVGFYQDLNSADGGFNESVLLLEQSLEKLTPGFTFDFQAITSQTAAWFAENLGNIFAGTVSTIFTFLIAIIGAFYFFRDGEEMLQLLIKASPLPDNEDRIIIDRTARAVRAVATGTLLLAMIQGTLVAIGFFFVGIERPILWGSLASVGALMPGIGTTIVTGPAVIILFLAGDMVQAVLLLIWAALVVGLVDNFVGPYLISRQSKMHPFIILIAVLGGISAFGPIGFIVGPVIVTLFFILLEIYNQYVVKEQPISELDDEL